MIKILQSVSSLGIGGNELSVMNFFRNIDKTKFQVDFIVYDERMEFAQEVTEAGAKIYLCPQKGGNRIARILREARFVYRTLKENNYDIIHCNGCSFVNILRAVIPAKLVGNIKVISHAHSIGKVEKNTAEKCIYACLKGLLSACVDLGFSCSSMAAESKYTNRFRASEKNVLIRNAIDAKRYQFNQDSRQQIRSQYGLEDKVVIGHIGRLSHEKNQAFLLDLLAKLREQRTDVALMLIGGGAMEEELKEKCTTLGLNDSVVFTGSVFDAEKYYSAMDVFVMPSLYEGLPFTAIEAQTNGLRCVLSNGVTVEANVSGDVVYLPLSADAAQWNNVILEQAQKRSESKNVQKVIESYDIRMETERLQALYRSVLQESGLCKKK